VQGWSRILMRAKLRPPVLLSYLAFVLVGVTAGIGGVLLPAQMSDYGVDRATIGITFFTLSAGYVLSSLSTGALIQRFGIRTALGAAGVLFVASGLYLATRPPFAAFVLAQVVTGYALGLLESSLNVYLAELPGAAALFNRMYAFFGVGALLGPALAAWIISYTSWTVVWLVLAVAYMPLTAGFGVAAYPGRRRAGEHLPAQPQAPRAVAAETAATAATVKPGPLSAALRDRAVLLCSAMLAVYVGLEISVGNWAYSYLVQARGMPGSFAAYPVSGYWLGLALGRFVIGPVAGRIGASTAHMLYACLAGISIAVTLAWVSPTAALTSVALVMLGFFLGPVFPTTMAITPQLTKARLVPTAIGVMNAASLVGGSVLPWLAGAIAGRTGVWTLMPFALVLAVLQIAMWRPIAGRIRTPQVAVGLASQD
jgi:fucose permease